MSDRDRKQSGGAEGSNPRKRRYRDDEDQDRRGSRRRYETPPHIRIRKALLALAENPMRAWHEETSSIASLVADNWDDEFVRNYFVDLVLQLALEQPLKTPFVAAVILVANTHQGKVAALVDQLLGSLSSAIQIKIAAGGWRHVKLYLKLVACLQSCLEGDGIFPVLEELFARAGVLQTASSEDTLGMDLVRIILLTIPYAMAAADPTKYELRAADLMEKTEIIASEPHALQPLIDSYHPTAHEPSPTSNDSVIGLLQKQLQAEASNGWPLACLPRPWQQPAHEAELQAALDNCPKHALPTISIPESVVAGSRLIFPEVYFSVYYGQDVESVPPITSIAASLIRDGLLDTINVMDYNRMVTARHLIEVDCFFAPKTFAARATPFDRLRDIEPPRSTWKPEDVAVDTVFSQLFLLPAPEHKLVYYHSVLTEACKQAPAAIAPSLGRAIRSLYRKVDRLDLEIMMRFIDWFSHHLSNFGFTWKWAEWVEDVELSDLHHAKAFILAAIDHEIRLSFAQRIKNTLPEPYQALISPAKESEVPDFKFAKEDTPFSAEGRELASLLKRKAPDEEIQPIIDRIHATSIEQGLDPMVSSTDVFVTAVLHVGSKSLSHAFAVIEPTKDRLVDAGAASEPARAQVVTAVMDHWHAHSGVALAIVEKLVYWDILAPRTVVDWALTKYAKTNGGKALAQAHIYEMVFNTVNKATNRVRHIALEGEDMDGTQGAGGNEEVLDQEVKTMRELFRAIEVGLSHWTAAGGQGEEDQMLKRWAEQWLRVFQRRARIDEASLVELKKMRAARAAAAAKAKAAAEAATLAADAGVAGGAAAPEAIAVDELANA